MKAKSKEKAVAEKLMGVVPTCKDCQWWAFNECEMTKKKGECRAHAPHAHFEKRWATTRSFDWCVDFELRSGELRSMGDN